MVWGTETVFEATMKVLKDLNQRVQILKPLRDIDTVDDLKNLNE
jgi:glycosyltransferase A (GT-A) superfamily protein (DUF2064 family)